MPKALDLIGQRFGKLTVLDRHGKTPAGQYTYRCICDCGKESIARTGCLRNGHTKSCGCMARYSGRNSGRFKHGLSDKSHPENKRYQRECYDRFKYGLEPEQKAAMLANQNGCCAICGYQFGQEVGDMHVDHNHLTGNVRGLLCDICNRGLGYFKDNPNRLTAASFYLAR
jgi:hypothetical protein